jgi:hypothetical protein
MPNVNVLPRNLEGYADSVELPLTVVLVWCGDDDAAADDTVMEPFELRRLLANAGFNGRRSRHILKADLQ